MKTLERKPVLALLGGIGSGKSTVAKAVAELRPVHLIDADQMGHQAYFDPLIRQRVTDRFGLEILNSEGQISRPSLAALVFGSTPEHLANLRELESIVHPWILNRIKAELAVASQDASFSAILLDAPILLEAGWQGLCDRVIFLEVSEPSRRERVQARKWTDEQWRQREQAQRPLVEKRRAADLVVSNEGQPRVAAEAIVASIDQFLRWRQPVT